MLRKNAILELIVLTFISIILSSFNRALVTLTVEEVVAEAEEKVAAVDEVVKGGA